MTIVSLMFVIAVLPLVILGTVALIYGLYSCWIVLLAICGLRWAQNKWRDMP
jgi:hypothetical protein